jgi:tetrahydromethanopterin S-methyltransferase subunit B
MQWMADNILYVLVIGTVIIVALVALLLFMRNKGED